MKTKIMLLIIIVILLVTYGCSQSELESELGRVPEIHESEIVFTVEPRPTDTRKTLSLVMSPPFSPNVLEAINDFNDSNEEYRIEIIRVDAENISRLQIEIMTGQMPDILFYGDDWDFLRVNLPAHRLAARGFLANLYDFIDSDTELGRESFMPNLLKAVSDGDVLYELPFRFWLMVAVGDANRLGSELGWTFEDLISVLEETDFDGSLLCLNRDRQSILREMLTFLIDDFIDWDTGNAYFNTPEFQKLLEVVKTYTQPNILGAGYSEIDYIAQGRLLMKWQAITSPNFLQYFDVFFEEMVPIGLPASTGVGNAIRFDTSFSISAASEHPEAAWSFIRRFYLPEYFEEDQYLIPFHVDAIEAWLYLDDPGFTLALDDFVITVGDATDYDIERTRRILESITRVARVDRDVFMIILEEADVFFRGGRSAEDTARIIQNRVQTYLHEMS